MNVAVDPFPKDLAESQETVLLVAKWIRERGNEVVVMPLRCRPTRDQWPDYTDEGDLYVNGKRYEVKRIQHDFTCRDDFPYKNVLVFAKAAWDKADPKPEVVVIVNRGGENAAVVMGSTFDKWVVMVTKDARYHERTMYAAYYCPKELVSFQEITQEVGK